MLAFKHPEYLFFLFAIAIPIIIHLFSFRKYKKVYFHNLQLIKNIQIEQNSTKSKLKELLILISRIGMITFLVLAFAQPYIPHDNNHIHKSDEAIAIYIDNSFSTQSESENGIVLEFEKKKAIEITDAYSAETKFYLFTNNSNSTEYIAKTREEIKNEISELTLSPNKLLLSNVLKKINTCAKTNDIFLNCHIVSDMQKNTFDIEKIQTDSSYRLTFYPIENQEINNISIDSCYFENQHHIAGQPEKITALVSNNSDETFSNFPIKLYINDTLRALSSATLKPHAKISVPIEYNVSSKGILSGKLELEDYPILYDNTFYFSYSVENQINILDLNEGTANKNIVALCKDNNSFLIVSQSIKSVDYSTLTNYHVIILDELQTIPSGLIAELNKMNSIGKTIVCIPSENIDIESYNNFISSFGRQHFVQKDSTKNRIEFVDEQNSIFKNVFENTSQTISYPEIFMHYQLEPQSNNALITLENKNAFLSQISSKNCVLFLFSSPLSSKHGNFVISPLFVGIHNILTYVSNSNELQTTIGNSTELFSAKFNNNEALHIENKANQIDVIPQYHNDLQTSKIIINPMQQITTAGNYFITQKSDAICGISYNYDRSESIFEFYSPNEIENFIEHIPNSSVVNPTHEITNTLKELDEGTPLWRIALFTAIFFVLTEIFLITFYDKIIQREPK